MNPEHGKLPPHFYSRVSSTLFHTLFLSISFFNFHQSINSLELLIHFRPHPDCVWIKITGLCLIASSSTTTPDKSPADGTYTHPSWVTLLLVVLVSCTIAVTPSIFSHRNETVSSCADSCASSDCRHGLDLDSACLAFDRAEPLPKYLAGQCSRCALVEMAYVLYRRGNRSWVDGPGPQHGHSVSPAGQAT